MQPRPLGTPSVAFVYSSAPAVELFLNGESLGKQTIAQLGYASWTFPYEPGNLTAVDVSGTYSSSSRIGSSSSSPRSSGNSGGGDVDPAVDFAAGGVAGAAGSAVSDTVLTAGPATQLRFVLDVPSTRTGTGERLVADGADAGLVRVTLLDAAGNFAPDSGVNVTFAIVDGPGRLIGVGNGDPKCVEPNQASWRSTFKGLVRAVVQVDQICPPEDWIESLLRFVDVEGGSRTKVCNSKQVQGVGMSITVEASADGFASQRLTIPVSVDVDADSVLATAARNIAVANLGY